MSVLGLDIGGANLKVATSDGGASHVAFALWKDPAGLVEQLRTLVVAHGECDRLAVTMTGELCDCFESKREGVNRILDAVESVAGRRPIHVWTNAGRFVDLPQAREQAQDVASANWLAQATLVAARLPSPAPALLIDIGTTTTDVVPLNDRKPVPAGRTDTERLQVSELVYRGWRRTPLTALIPDRTAAEWFATTHDVCLLLEMRPEDPSDTDTADGQPATRLAAERRIARLVCGDLETTTARERLNIAEQTLTRLIGQLLDATTQVQARLIDQILQATPIGMPVGSIELLISSGSGDFLVPKVLEEISWQGRTVPRLLPFDHFAPGMSAVACAYAVAVLCEEAPPGMIVVKVGGSLFDMPDLRSRLLAFLATLPDDRLLVPGGGAAADAVRALDRAHGLPADISHRLALRACSLNAHFLAALLGASVVARPGPGLAILDAFAFACEDESLPASWDATSDSVAARAAALLGAELVLLKSVDMPTDMTWRDASRQGVVDALFPDLVERHGLRVRVVNLRQ